MEYEISKKEIKRRKEALLRLIVSFDLAYFVLFGFLFFNNFVYFASFILIINIVYILFIFYIYQFFKSYSRVKIIISQDHLERKTSNAIERLFLNSIKNITIVKTFKDKIREIRIFANNKTLVLDGVENFSGFVDELLNKIKNIKPGYKKEPLDYDHPLFYILLGLLLGVLSILFMNKIIQSDFQVINIIQKIIAIFASLLGLYFMIGKPLSKRYDYQKSLPDYIWGIIFIISGLSIFILSFFMQSF